MEKNNVFVDPIHIFNDENFEINPISMGGPKKIYFIAEQKDNHQLFYLVKKGEKFFSKTKKAFIDYLEKSTELIHPSIVNLSGYSTDKPYLYYKYSQEPLFINNIKLTDENVQKMLSGIASALSYLSSKGYYFKNISFNSIIFDSIFLPKIFDYIDFENKSKCTERDMIIKYVELMQKVIKKKIDEDPTIPINDKLKSLIDKFQDKQEENLPTFNDFLNFFKNNSFRGKEAIYRLPSIERSFEILDLQDIIIFDNAISKKIVKVPYDFISKRINKIRNFDSIEQIVFYFLRKRKIQKIAEKKLEMLEKNQTPNLSKDQIAKIERKHKILKDKHLFILNSLPEYYIKPLNLICEPLSNKLIRYLYNEDISLVIPNWKDICKSDFFTIYKHLMKQMKKLEKQKNQIFYFDEETKKLNYKIEAIRIKAIEFLNKESEQSNEGKIELAIQYIKNDILPINYDEAKNILKSISNANKQTNTLIDQMKSKIKTIQSKSIDDFIQDLPENQQKIYKDAKEGKNVLSMLYVAFALYTGFNGFPIIRSLSIQYYKEAAKLSPEAMTLLGFLYFNGLFFPQNLNEARKCFRCAAYNGSLKGEIIDGILRHVWRSYLVKFEINDLFKDYLQTFESMIPNDSLVFPKINYLIDNNFQNDCLCEVELSKVNKIKKSDNDDKNQSMFLKYQDTYEWEKQIKQFFSAKVLYPSEEPTDVKNALDDAKSYFYGDNNFPVNYEQAKKLFKLAADKGDSEAQWRYALSVINFNDSENYKEKDIEDAGYYLYKSAEKGNIRGKLYYAIFLKQVKKDYEEFKKIIKECCESNNPDAMYYYGMYLEYKDLDQSIRYYKNAADLGHFDALIRLIQLLRDQIQEEQDKKEKEKENKKHKNDKKNEDKEKEEDEKEEEDNDDKVIEEGEEVEKQISLYNYYFELSAGILNENIISDLIIFYDEKQKYEQSNALIQIGVLINHYRFNTFYIDHLLNGKGMDINIIRAKKLALFALQNQDQDQNQIFKYKEKYNYLLLQILVTNNEHQKAFEFLLTIKNEPNENREEFHKFYQKFDKNLAKRYFIPACFYYKKFIKCHDLLMHLYRKNTNMVHIFGKFIDYVKRNENPFAMAILGKLYKEEKHFIIIRSLRKAIKYFAKSAEAECPLGYYYLGKEYYYGRYLDQDYKKAKKLLLKAIKNNEEPRAGYYLYKIIRDYEYKYKYEYEDDEDDENDENENEMKNEKALKMLKIGVEFECKRALFHYGKLLYNGIVKDEIDGKKLILKACKLNNKKAKKFCVLHGISLKEIEKKSDLSINEDDSAEISSDFYKNQEENKFGLVCLDESKKNDELVKNNEDNQNIELLSIGEDSSIINANSSSLPANIKLEKKKHRNDDDDYSISSEVKNINGTNLNNAKDIVVEDRNVNDLNSFNNDDENSFDIGFWY